MPSSISSPEFSRINTLLNNFAGQRMVGLTSLAYSQTLIRQLIDSIRRVEYLRLIAVRSRSSNLFRPYSGSFNPLCGAVSHFRTGNTDDACWLVFLATHFGKHRDHGWKLTENFYGKIRQGGVWDWTNASQNPMAISQWLQIYSSSFPKYGRSLGFGNHRKYESLNSGGQGTGAVVETYINWVQRHGSHQALFDYVQNQVGQNPKENFNFLYREMNAVARFGRLGKFDYLCNISNLSISSILPDKAYISESTGPKSGAKLLFGSNLGPQALEAACLELADHLGVSPQVIEDALCNWQKSPTNYTLYRG